VVWIALIVLRAFAGNTTLETPYSAFAVVVAVSLLLFVEGMRTRRKAIA
jgi:Na+/H+ antiporter NhaD/arsenite permease-like protein